MKLTKEPESVRIVIGSSTCKRVRMPIDSGMILKKVILDITYGKYCSHLSEILYDENLLQPLGYPSGDALIVFYS